MKKYLSVLFVMLISVFILNGCSDKNVPESDNVSTSVGQDEKNESGAAAKTDKEDTVQPDTDSNNVNKSEEASDNTDSAKVNEADDASAEAEAEAGIKEEDNSSVGSGTVTSDVADGYIDAENKISITRGGEYTFKGKFDEKQIFVNAAEAEVILIFDGVELSNSIDSPIYVEEAEDVTLKVLEGSENTVTDLRPLKIDDDEESGSACIFSKEDLKLSGKGKLTVNASYNNGVHSKKDIKIKNLTLEVYAPDNAVKGNDSITIESGNLKLTSTQGDGLKTKNTDISPKGKQRGIITIESGIIDIYAADDCINAAYDVVINEGPDTKVNQHLYEK